MEVVALDDKTSPRHERRPRYPCTTSYSDFCQGVFNITPKRDPLRAARVYRHYVGERLVAPAPE